MGAPDLPTIAKAISATLIPHVASLAKPPNALYPRPAWSKRAAAAPAKAAPVVASGAVDASSVAVSATPTPPARAPRGESRRNFHARGVLAVDLPQLDHGPIVINLVPMARFTPAHQAAVTARAQGVLADAVAQAKSLSPDVPVSIRVTMRSRVVASTDPTEIVSVRPPQPAPPSRPVRHGAPSPAKPA